MGIRHAARPASTVLIKSHATRLPFDVAMLRTLSYRLGSDGKPSHPKEDAGHVGNLLKDCRDKYQDDSPLFQLLNNVTPLKVQSDKTDVFRERVEYSERKKAELAAIRDGAREGGNQARKAARNAMADVQGALEPLDAVEAGVLIDLLLSYRAVEAWTDMVDFVKKLPEPIKSSTLVQEQLGFALNRAGKPKDAEAVLQNIIERQGPSSETYRLLGRVFKDLWDKARKEDHKALASAYLDKAIDAYRTGFEIDWRDHYPGVNAVTLMELRDPPDPQRLELLPVVSYAARRNVEGGKPDYWDWATLLELAVLTMTKSQPQKPSDTHWPWRESLGNARQPHATSG